MFNFDQIEFEAEVNHIEKRQQNLAEYLDEREEDNLKYPCICNAIVCNAKANEADPVTSPIKGTRRPGDRASRRKANAHKKNALGRKVRYANEYINAYFVKGNGQTRWIKDIIKENAWDEFDSIDWSKVKGINPKNYGYKQYDKSYDWIKSRHNAKEVCRTFEDDGVDLSDPWAYTEEEKWELGYDYLHGDFDDETTETIIQDRYLIDDADEYYCWDYEDEYHELYKEYSDLRREITRYKDFLGEFNLNTLYQRWLSDNNS